MSIQILKPTSNEVSISSANLVYGAALVRVVNPTAAPVVMTLTTNTALAYANVTILANTEILVIKATTDTLTGAGLVAAPAAYRGL
jgi:hypothetical protein